MVCLGALLLALFRPAGDAAVAVGRYGRGAVGYFGDVKGEENAFCVLLLFLVTAKCKSE